MNSIFTQGAWNDYLSWQKEDKKKRNEIKGKNSK